MHLTCIRSRTRWWKCRPTPTSSIPSLRSARGGHINLVETFGERIAESCLADSRIVAVRVRLEKLERGPVRGVEIVRPATKAAAAEFGRG